MSDLRELYQDLILDHGRKPRNFRELEGARSAEGYNPLCGDEVRVFVKLDGDVVEDVSFQGQGCAISTASASLMTQALKGKTVADAAALFRTFHELVTGQRDDEEGRQEVGLCVGYAPRSIMVERLFISLISSGNRAISNLPSSTRMMAISMESTSVF